MLTNKEQLYQSFSNRSRNKKIKAKKKEGGGGQFDPPPLLSITSRVNNSQENMRGQRGDTEGVGCDMS